MDGTLKLSGNFALRVTSEVRDSVVAVGNQRVSDRESDHPGCDHA